MFNYQELLYIWDSVRRSGAELIGCDGVIVTKEEITAKINEALEEFEKGE